MTFYVYYTLYLMTMNLFCVGDMVLNVFSRWGCMDNGGVTLVTVWLVTRCLG